MQNPSLSFLYIYLYQLYEKKENLTEFKCTRKCVCVFFFVVTNFRHKLKVNICVFEMIFKFHRTKIKFNLTFGF